MAKTARFFLSRITKGGTLEAEGVLDALRRAPAVTSREFAWTVVDVTEDTVTHDRKRHRYLAGKFVKYDPNAFVEVVDEESRRTRLQSEPNMQRAASLFVYLPDEAIFAHRHVWNEIRDRDFRLHLADMVVDYYRGFFVECELHAVTDLTRFLTRLGELEEVTALKARVAPPNPLFGVFWADLREYLEQRRLRQMTIRESAAAGTSVRTNAPEIVRRIEAGTLDDHKPAPIGDAAVLMAADGYGAAEVIGRRGTDEIVVRTADNAIQLKLDAEITPAELAAVLVREVAHLAADRKLRHG